MKYSFNPVADLCRLLEDTKVPFVFIRDMSSIEEVVETERGDVDIFCTTLALPKLRAALGQLGWFRLFGGEYYVSMESELVFDIHCDYYRRLPMLSAQHMFTERRKVYSTKLGVDLPLLPDHLILTILLLHPLDLTGFRGQRSYSVGRKKKIYELWNEKTNKERLSIWMLAALGHSVSERIEKVMGYDILKLFEQVNCLRLMMYIQKPSNLTFLLRRLVEKIRPELMYKGQIIAVIGVDGSGKSTLIEGLSAFVDRYFNEQGKAKVLYMGRQGGFRLPLTNLARLKKKIQRTLCGSTTKDKKVESVIQNSQTLRKKNVWLSLIWQIVFVCEFTLRLVELLYHRRLKRQIVITDRYISDFILDDNHKCFYKFLHWMYPRPDIIFNINGDPLVFFLRKGEQSPLELKNQQDKMNNDSRMQYIGKKLITLNGNQASFLVLRQAICAISED